MPKIISDISIRNEAVKMLCDGISIDIIAETLSVSRKEIRNSAHKVGITSRLIFEKSGAKNRLCQLLDNGLGYNEIERIMNKEGFLTISGKKFKRSNVFTYIKRELLPVRRKIGDETSLRWNRFYKKALKMHGDKFLYNENSFVTINTEMDIFCNTCKCWYKERPNAHINSSEFRQQLSGCKNCSYNIIMGKKTELFNASLDFLSDKLEDGITRIDNWLESKNILYTRGYKIIAGTTGRELRFDYYLNDLNIVLDYHSELEYGRFERPDDEYEHFINLFRYNGFKIGYCMAEKIKIVIIAYFQDVEKTLQIALNTLSSGESFFPLVGEAIKSKVDNNHNLGFQMKHLNDTFV